MISNNQNRFIRLNESALNSNCERAKCSIWQWTNMINSLLNFTEKTLHFTFFCLHEKTKKCQLYINTMRDFLKEWKKKRTLENVVFFLLFFSPRYW